MIIMGYPEQLHSQLFTIMSQVYGYANAVLIDELGQNNNKFINWSMQIETVVILINFRLLICKRINIIAII